MYNVILIDIGPDGAPQLSLPELEDTDLTLEQAKLVKETYDWYASHRPPEDAENMHAVVVRSSVAQLRLKLLTS